MAKVNLKTLSRNTLVAGLAEVWRVISRFVLTPIIIGAVGFEGYGVWTLVFSVAAYVSMTNASFGLAYTKFTAECMQSGDHDRLSRIIGAGMLSVGSVSIFAFGAIIIWGESIMRLLNAPPNLVEDGAIALIIVTGVLVMRMTIGCCHEILGGLQRMDLASRLMIIASIVEFCVSVPLLMLDYGIVGLAIGHLVGYGMVNFLAYRLVRKHAPQIRISPFIASREGVRQVFAVGGRFQLLMVVNTLSMHGGKMLISHFFGAYWVAVYQLADRLLELGKAASASVVGPLMPAFADAQARKDAKQERLLFLKGSKVDGLVGGTAIAFLAVFAPWVVIAWTGEAVAASAWGLRVMAIGDGLFILTSVVSSNLRAQGKVWTELTAAVISAVIGFSIFWPLIQWVHFDGVIYARVIAQLIAASWYMSRYFKIAGIPLSEYIAGTRTPRTAVVLLLAMSVSYMGSTYLPIPPLLNSVRIHAAINIGVWGIPFGLIFSSLAWLYVLDDEERERLRGLFGKLRRKLGLA